MAKITWGFDAGEPFLGFFRCGGMSEPRVVCFHTSGIAPEDITELSALITSDVDGWKWPLYIIPSHEPGTPPSEHRLPLDAIELIPANERFHLITLAVPTLDATKDGLPFDAAMPRPVGLPLTQFLLHFESFTFSGRCGADSFSRSFTLDEMARQVERHEDQFDPFGAKMRKAGQMRLRTQPAAAEPRVGVPSVPGKKAEE